MNFNDIFKSSFLENITSVSLLDMLLTLALAFGLGMFIFLVYKKTYSGVMYSSSFGGTLVALTMITGMTILAVTSNVVLSLGMVGALSIVRFRTAIKEPMDIAFLFWSIAAGIVLAAGMIPLAVIGSVIIGVVMLVFINRKAVHDPYIAVITCENAAAEKNAVIRYMAVHNFLCNDDSYTGMMVHNYYLYEEDGVLSMIPWDYNLAFGGFSGGNATSTVNTSIRRLVSMGNDSDRPMAGWITASEAYTAQYLAAYADFMSTVFDSGWFAEEIDSVVSMIAPYVQNDPTAFCTYEEFQTGVETLKQFCLKRAESVNRQLNGETENVDASELDLSAMGSMGNMGGGGPGGMGFPGGDFSRGGKGRENQKRPAAEAAESPDAAAEPTPSADAGKQPNAFTPPNAEDWKNMRSMQPAETFSNQGFWLAVCLALLLIALLLAWCWPNKR